MERSAEFYRGAKWQRQNGYQRSRLDHLLAEAEAREAGPNKGHKWELKPSMLPYPVCRVCGVVQRKDGQNSPCKGPVSISTREASVPTADVPETNFGDMPKAADVVNELKEALEEIDGYRGGADTVLEDRYVTERRNAALELAREYQQWMTPEVIPGTREALTGLSIRPPSPKAAEVIAAAERALEAVFDRFGAVPLYARVDMVRGEGGDLLLMELEVLEPYLFPEEGPGIGAMLGAALARRLAS